MGLNEFLENDAVDFIMDNETDNAVNLVATIIEAMQEAQYKPYLEQRAYVGGVVHSYMIDMCDEFELQKQEADNTAEIESHLIDAQEAAHQARLAA